MTDHANNITRALLIVFNVVFVMSFSRSIFSAQKYPDMTKKNGTANLAKMYISVPASRWFPRGVDGLSKGGACIAITNTIANTLKKSTLWILFTILPFVES